ncbi:MAG: hypothetical protein GY826_22565, partial [Fuerstiella sp.]|nr:hypothetical protein [Fuerstiella sp.]
ASEQVVGQWLNSRNRREKIGRYRSVVIAADGFEAAPVESESVAGTDIGRRASATGSPVEPSVRAWQVLCWVLRRFVETDFVRRYMPESPDLQDGPVN